MELKEIIEKVDRVQGWFFRPQMEFLYPYACKAKRVFEIGTYAGRSTLFWTLCNPKAEIITVDNCVGDPLGNVTSGTSIDPNIVKKGNILAIHEHSHALVNRFNLPIDILFVDGSHDFDSLCQDLDDWLPKTNGIVVCHDYMDVWPTVKQAVDFKLRGKYEILTDQFGLFVIKTH